MKYHNAHLGHDGYDIWGVKWGPSMKNKRQGLEKEAADRTQRKLEAPITCNNK